MPRLSTSFVVNRPVEDVFTYLASFENRLEYEQGLVEAEQTSDGPFGLGTTGRDMRRAMGKSMESTARISAYEPNKTFTFESTSGPMEFKGTWSFEPAESTTKVSFDMEGRMNGIMRLLEPILAGKLRKEMDGNIVRIKNNLESQG